jgi:excisionase family DNA binding protein
MQSSQRSSRFSDPVVAAIQSSRAAQTFASGIAVRTNLAHGWNTMENTQDKKLARPANGTNRKAVLTTGQVAKICSVAPRTVSKWFDSGQLRGYRIPGSKDRRIPVDQLVRFMKEHGIPTDGLELDSLGVLIVDNDAGFLSVLTEALSASGDYSVNVADSAFEAGILAQQHHPSVIVVDVSLSDVDAKNFVKTLRSNEQLNDAKLIAVSGAHTDGQCQCLLQEGFAGFLRKPFEVKQLQQLIEKIVANGTHSHHA